MKLIFKNEVTDESYNCRMCGVVINQLVGQIESVKENLEVLKIFKCKNCESITIGGVNPVIGYQDSDFEREYWRHYAETGAGIKEMLEPLFMLGEHFKGDILDVGCGFGYTVNFVNTMKIGNAVGLETADYGVVGAKLLDETIHNSLYSECSHITGKEFDIIYSSEVIEHVTNPHVFIKEISTGLKKNGILVLTTPSANGFCKKRDSDDVIATLSPYFHYFVSSRSALEKLLKQCHFSYVRVDELGNRLFAWASNSPLPKIEKRPFQDQYYSYLLGLSENPDISISSGALQRLLKEGLRDGLIDVSWDAFNRLQRIAEIDFGVSLEPSRGSDKITNVGKGVFNRKPSWLGSSLLFAALLVGIKNGDYRKKVYLLDLACNELKKETQKMEFQQYAQESHQLLPIAYKERAVAYSEAILRDIDELFQERKHHGETFLRVHIILLKTVIMLTLRTNKKELAKLLFNRAISDCRWWGKNWKKRLVSFMKEKAN